MLFDPMGLAASYLDPSRPIGVAPWTLAQKNRSDELDRIRFAERQAVAELIAERDAEQRRLGQQQNQFDADLRQRQVEFGEDAMIGRRRQRLAEVNFAVDALLGDRRAETDRLSVLGRNENYRRQNDLREMQARADQAGIDGSGLLPHQRGEWLAKSTGMFEDQVAGLRETVASAPLTEEGKRVWGELSGELRAIEQQRDFLRPDQYNQALGQWIDKAKRSRLDSMVKPPPTAGDVIGQQYDPETGIFVQQDSQGLWQARPLLSAEDQRREIALKEKELEWKMRGESGGDVMSSPRVSKIMDLDSDSLADLRKNATDAIIARREMQSGEDGGFDQEISPDELFREMKSQFDRERRLKSLIESDMDYSQWMDRQDSPSRVPERFMMPNASSEDDLVSPSDQFVPPSYDDISPEDTLDPNFRLQQRPVAGTQLPETPPVDERVSDQEIDQAVNSELMKRLEDLDSPRRAVMGEPQGLANLKVSLNKAGMDKSAIEKMFPAFVFKATAGMHDDPIDAIANAAAKSLNEGLEHFSLMPSMEQRMHEIEGTPVIPTATLESIPEENLPPVFFDEHMNLYRRGGEREKREPSDSNYLDELNGNFK